MKEKQKSPMTKKSKIVIAIVVVLLLVLIVVFRDRLLRLDEPTGRIDVHEHSVVQLPPAYDHGDNPIQIQDVVLYDLSGSNERFTERNIAWSYAGEGNGLSPEIEFATVTPGVDLISDVLIHDSYLEFVPVSDQGRGTAVITITIGQHSRTMFVKLYDLSLRLIALEFDDGPSRYTRDIVESLNNSGVSASFYVTGRMFHDIAHEYVGVEVYPELALFAFASGHHIGNHTFSHPWIVAYSGDFHQAFPPGQYRPWWEYSEEEVIWQVKQADEAIYRTLGFIPNYYAPPYYFEGHNETILALGKTLSSRFYAIDIGDWHPETTKEDIIERVLSAPNNSTVVLHDVYQKTAEAIEYIMNSSRALEIQFVTGYELDMILGRE